jgi:cytidylate kinase
VRVIAIDGPSGSGKSTVAKAVARRLGLEYLDTGAMYRAVAFAAIRRQIDPEDAAAVAERQLELEVGEKVLVDGADATIEIRTPAVTRAVSIVAANPEVRHELVRRQRQWAETRQGGVIEGRDIGTVVFPDADVKFFIDADPTIRARRRYEELFEKGVEKSLQDVQSEQNKRDKADREREAAPLVAAADAIRLDSTAMPLSEVVQRVEEAVRAKLA